MGNRARHKGGQIKNRGVVSTDNHQEPRYSAQKFQQNTKETIKQISKRFGPRFKTKVSSKQVKDTLDALLRVVELGELVGEYLLAEGAVGRAAHGGELERPVAPRGSLGWEERALVGEGAWRPRRRRRGHWPPKSRRGG